MNLRYIFGKHIRCAPTYALFLCRTTVCMEVYKPPTDGCGFKLGYFHEKKALCFVWKKIIITLFGLAQGHIWNVDRFLKPACLDFLTYRVTFPIFIHRSWFLEANKYQKVSYIFPAGYHDAFQTSPKALSRTFGILRIQIMEQVYNQGWNYN